MAVYRKSYEGIGRMLHMPELTAAMTAHAEGVKARAEATAPVGDPRYDPHSGRYKASFVVESTERHDRTGARVVNLAPEAVYVEYGNRHEPGRHTLLIAASARD